MRRVREAANDRSDDLGEVGVVHAQRVGVRAGVEHQLRLADEAAVDEHSVTVHHAEGRHRADFELRVYRRNLVLMREPQRDRVREIPQHVESHGVVSGHDRL